jgi:hypothetical protein
MPAEMLLEIAVATPLFATIVSVGIVRAPPLLPGFPSSWASNPAVAPGGAGDGSDGEAPGPDTVT